MPDNAFDLLLHTDAGMRLAGVAFLAGQILGMILLAACCWRRLTHTDGGRLRLYQATVDDLHTHNTCLLERADGLAREASEKQRTIDEQTIQIGGLYKDLNRISRLYVEQAERLHQTTAPSSGYTAPVLKMAASS